ncbi:NAD+ synthetase [Chitinivorax tropicus]|uniref:Glutamine-dependent NAD(+) synthetase n=1 Tax=Chitinivorax tropicus TaxID=714531 RepID=A0A840MFV0_9PROT|nr:NAD+ synthase [Chitinivorax tropicus]MBB5017538.1 NAD+ synthetase [Chitinivorax tropicus]
MKLAIAQFNPTVGDLVGNAGKIIEYVHQARELGADLLLTPEFALCGYPPEDLLLRPAFYTDCATQLARVAMAVQDIALVVSYPLQEKGRRYNAASVIRNGKIIATYRKISLPNDEVFDEKRYFDAGGAPCVVEIAGVKVGINICEDIWQAQAAALAKSAGAEVIVVPNASPFHIDKQKVRFDVVKSRVAQTGLPIAYANLTGGQDELVFDGQSFLMNRKGEVVAQLPMFDDAIGLFTYEHGDWVPAEVPPAPSIEAQVYKALTIGVRDYIGKNGFPGALLGLSGGIDSALTLAVAVDALGPERVHAVMMPSQYTAGMSVDDSREMVGLLGVKYSEIPIKPVFDSFLSALSGEFAGLAEDTTEENIQARVRGTLLMALSNKTGRLVLTTGNKSEMAVGYATLYGDMAGGFAVLKDVAKTLVYRLSNYRNTLSTVIPERIITRPPSAELRENQTDQDSLPPYDVLDGIMQAYVERNQSPQEIIAEGYTEADVKRVIRLIKVNEYKRRQAPVGVRITARGYGKDWRYPITNRYSSGM